MTFVNTSASASAVPATRDLLYSIFSLNPWQQTCEVIDARKHQSNSSLSDSFLLKERGWLPVHWFIQSKLSAKFTMVSQYAVSLSFPENTRPGPTRVSSLLSASVQRVLLRHHGPLSTLPCSPRRAFGHGRFPAWSDLERALQPPRPSRLISQDSMEAE